MRLIIGLAAIVAGLIVSAGAQAQWTVINLHPAGATRGRMPSPRAAHSKRATPWWVA